LSSINSVISFKSIFLAGLIGAALYYGWPIIEAIILILPIPDPKGAVDGMKAIGG